MTDFYRSRLLGTGPRSSFGNVGVDSEIVEFIPDGEPSQPTNNGDGLPPVPIMVRKATPLKSHVKRKAKEMEEDEDAGINEEDYQCEPCRIGNDDLTPETSEALRDIYDLDRKLFLTIPDDEIFRIMAQTYNDTIYDVNVNILKRQHLKKWTKASVRRHITKHSRSNPHRLIWNRLLFCEDALSHIEENGFFDAEYEKQGDGTEVQTSEPEQINPRNHKAWVSLVKAQTELFKLDLSIRQQETKDIKIGSSNYNGRDNTDRGFNAGKSQR